MEETIEDFIVVSEVDRGTVFVDSIFQYKYRQNAPDFPHHIVAFYKKSEDCFVPISYVNFHPYQGVMLVGGGCTDGRAFTHMTEMQKNTVRANGGLLLQTLRFGFHKFAQQCEAYFGYCGDARAYEVDLQAGFIPTQHIHLLVHWHRSLSETRKLELISMTHALGPF